MEQTQVATITWQEFKDEFRRLHQCAVENLTRNKSVSEDKNKLQLCREEEKKYTKE